MCNLPGRFFRGTFSGTAGHAGSVADWKLWHRQVQLRSLSVPENKGKIAFFGGINKCKFRGKVLPGDKLKLETRIIKQKGPVGVGEAVATVDGKVVVKCRTDIYDWIGEQV